MRVFALSFVPLLAACPPAGSHPNQQAQALGDHTCEAVAWSCVGMNPDSDEAWGCIEGTANERARYEGTCTAEKHGRFALSPCPRDHLVGGCTLARESTCVTTWLAAPATQLQVNDECAHEGALITTP